MSNTLPDHLKESYEALDGMRVIMDEMKKNQSLRGVDNLLKRIEHRNTTHKTWRQMKGMQLFMHEINHPGNKPFVIGLAITSSVFMYAYFAGLKSDQAKLESKYYQRFHAKHDEIGYAPPH